MRGDSDVFALLFISSSGPKEILQQGFFFLRCLEHFDPQNPVSALPPDFSLTRLGTFLISHDPMAQGTFHFRISYHVKDGREPPDVVLIVTEARMCLSNLHLVPGAPELMLASISPTPFKHFIESLHLKPITFTVPLGIRTNRMLEVCSIIVMERCPSSAALLATV